MDSVRPEVKEYYSNMVNGFMFKTKWMESIMMYEPDYLVHSSQMQAHTIFSLMIHDMPWFPFIIHITPVIQDSSYTFFVLENDGMFL